MSKVSVGIVTHNNENEINDLLNSIEVCNFKDVDVYIFDNNSSDNTIAKIKEKYEFVNIIESRENLGYGKGHNQIIKIIDSKYHIVVNPDIVIDRKQIELMIDFMEKNDDVAILTPKVLNMDGTEQYLPKRAPTVKYLLGRYENIFKICKKWRDEYTLKDIIPASCIEIDFCTGCFMFCRTTLLKEVCGFDERYFMYFEDADLTKKMQKLGKTIYDPNIFVIHKWKREDTKNITLKVEHIKSMLIFFVKWLKNE